MSERWQPPGYKALVGEIIRIHAGGRKGRFARLTKLANDEVNRWVGGLPGSHKNLLRWAEALGLPWKTIVTAEDASAATSAKPNIVQPPGAIRSVPMTHGTRATDRGRRPERKQWGGRM